MRTELVRTLARPEGLETPRQGGFQGGFDVVGQAIHSDTDAFMSPCRLAPAASPDLQIVPSRPEIPTSIALPILK
jgi:hypothetical protein